MISAGSRDGRNMSGLGFDVGGGSEMEMEDTELEEGEAFSYRNDEEVNIDPDDFTYIDEKLQNVLGHFKKDFEGGVFTENLGAKYGGYGSFLTQRSPVRPCSKSPANVQNSQSHKSPTCLSAEGGCYSSLAQSNGRHCLKHESSSIHAASSEHYKAPSRRDLMRQIVQVPKHSIEESSAKTGAAEKSNNIIEPRTLKVRIKVGSDNLSGKKNAAIYNGLGLVSPSSSFDDSPIGSERLSQGLHFPGDESPNQIIHTMTSLPVYGGLLLSPLPEALARLTEKLLQDNSVEPASRHDWVSSVLGSNGMEAKILPEGKNQAPSKRKKDSERALNDSNLISKNQADLGTEACEELVSEALKLPLLSDFHGSSGGKRGTSKQKTNVLSNALRHEPVVPILKCDGDWNKRQNGDENLAVNVAREEVDLQNDVPSYQKKGDRKGQVVNSLTNTDTIDFGAKSIKGSLTRPSDSQKRKIGKESTSIEEEGMKLPSGGEQLPLGDKKKLKASHATGSLAAEKSKGSIKKVVSGHKDNYMPDNHSCKVEIGSFPKKKDLTKFRDKYKDFFGDMIEDGDDSMDSPDKPSIDRLSTYKVSEKGLNSCENNTRERASKGGLEQLVPKVHPKRTPDFAPPEHVPLTGEPAPAGAPVEDWVQCDKCLKWRLLPFGTKGDSLPEKWLCSMLDWLPGMNSCSITEEETTKAVARLYQPQNLNGVNGILSESNPGTAANAMHPEQSHQDIFPNSGKKHDSKEVQNSKPSLKSNSLTVAARSQTENEPHASCSRVPTDPFLETNQHKKKSKKKHHDKYSNRGPSKITKREGEREPNQDHARAFKKMKVEEEAYISTHDTGSGKLIHNSNNELLISGAQQYQPVKRECSSRSSKGHTEDSLQNPIRTSKFQAQASPHADCLDARNDNDINGVVKKKKVKSSQSAYSPSSLTGKIFDENEETGQKKARLSVPEKKASSYSRGNSRADKKRKGTKDKDVDEHGSLKREVGAAATSSSSKVSGSQRSKSILRDVKSSPVESVSSSPFRTLDSDRYRSGIKNVMEKDTFHNIEILAKDNSIKVADAKAGSGSGRSFTMGNNLCGKNNNQSVHDLKDGTEGFSVVDKDQIKHSGDQADLLDHRNVSGIFLKQSAKESSQSKSDDKNQKFKSESDKGKVKMTHGLQDHAHVIKDTTKDINIKFQDKSGCDADSIEMDFGGKKKSSGIMLDEQSKKNSKLKSVGQEVSAVKADANLEMGSVAKKKANTDYSEKRSKRLEQDKDEEMDLQRGKEKATNKNYLSKSVSRPYQGNGADASGVHVRDSGKGLKEQMPSKKSDIHSSASKHQLSNVQKVKDGDAPSPMRRDSHNHAATNALKEAKDLKHLADRLKNSGSAESTGFYFEAALKFLHGASLLESHGSENSKRGDMIKSMQVYSSTAKLCEFCAHEYEKSKDQACAALAYKCMEVAYFRVIYSSNPAASRDRHELQRSLQTVPPGESPSSSASDIDNASNLATAEKAAQARDGISPRPAGNHVISASNRPNFERLMKYMQEVNSAMEASRRAQGAFAAAQADGQQARSNEGIAFVKRVVNFNFHDVDGLLRLVRLAVEAIK